MRTSVPSEEPVHATLNQSDQTPLEQGGLVTAVHSALGSPQRAQTIHMVLTFLTLLLAVLGTVQQNLPGNYAQVSLSCPSSPYFGLSSSSLWLRDLTREGVEPNPGPVMTSLPSSRPKGKKSGKKVVSVQVIPRQRTLKSTVREVVGPKATIGRRLGGWVGDMAQKAIMAITGFGDYQVKSNTLTNGGSPPAFAAGKHMTKVCHREFVGLVTSPGPTFTINQFPISPKSTFFPWLSEIALSFEQYIIRGMVVEFKSTSATAVASTNTALGSVILATQYNVLAPPFTSQTQMEAYEYCTSCSPSTSMIHPIECAPNLNSVSELYMDSGLGGDPRLEFLGTTYVATVGQQAASTVGELWVSYEIDLIRPKLFNGVSSAGLGAQVVFQHTNNIAMNQTLFPLIGVPPSSKSDLPITVTSGQTFSIPGWVSGHFLVLVTIQLTNTASSGNLSYSGSGVATVNSGAGAIINGVGFTGVTTTVSPLSGSLSPSGGDNIQISFYLGLAGTSPSVPVVVAVPGYSTYTLSTSYDQSISLSVTQVSYT